MLFRSAAPGDFAKCQVIFVGASDKKRVKEILDSLKKLPVLTVGESDAFAEQGGMITLVKKDGKVRFDVDLAAMREAGLQISSKVLGLADKVSGKQ